MRPSDAAMLVDKLIAAFPFPKPPEATAALYVEELAALGDVDAAQEAVQGLICSASRWPSLADLHGAYRLAASRRQEKQSRGHVLAELEVVPGPEHARAVLARLPVEGGPMTDAVRAFMQNVAGIAASGAGEGAAEEEVEANPGPCGQCHRDVPRRLTFGHFELCARCFDRRQKVARQVAELDHNNSDTKEER